METLQLHKIQRTERERKQAFVSEALKHTNIVLQAPSRPDLFIVCRETPQCQGHAGWLIRKLH
jgi:hypothetical protein